MISWLSFMFQRILKPCLNVSEVFLSPLNIVGPLPTSLPVRGAFTAAIITAGGFGGGGGGCWNRGTNINPGEGSRSGVITGGGGGTSSPASTACSISCW